MTRKTTTGLKGLPRPSQGQTWQEWANELCQSIENQAGEIVMVGMVAEFAGELPPGWLPISGSGGGTIKEANHPALYKLVGSSLPSADSAYPGQPIGQDFKVGIKA